MSISAIASVRPLHGKCFRHASSALLSLSLTSRTASIQFHIPIALHPSSRYQRCQYASTPQSKPPMQDRDRNSRLRHPQKQPVPFGKLLRRALVAGLRNLAFSLSPRGIKQAYRDYPTSTVAILVFSVFFWAFIVFILIDFYRSFYNEEISRFPDPVANTLRKALMHAFYRPDPELALKYFKQAMAQCDEIGLDPFSDEVLGVRIIIAAWLERIKHYEQSIQTLEVLLSDCQRWLGVFEQTVQDGKVTKEGRLVANVEKEKQDRERAIKEGREPEEVPPPVETMWRKRQRILSKAISTGIKLGELYASPYVLDTDNSRARLVWSVETSLKEYQRISKDGLLPGEEKEFMTAEELGASLESLGRDYERKSQFEFAIPLFFHALRLCESPCHRAVIMNNLAASFAQQPLLAAGSSTNSSSSELTTQSLVGVDLLSGPLPSTRSECLEAAENWARNALLHASDVKGAERTDECDSACAVSLCNWGDVAAMMGKPEVAANKYNQAIEMSRKTGFDEGIKQAESGLARLKAAAPAAGTSSSR